MNFFFFKSWLFTTDSEKPMTQFASQITLSAGIHCSYSDSWLTYSKRCLSQRAGVSKHVSSPDMRAEAQLPVE